MYTDKRQVSQFQFVLGQYVMCDQTLTVTPAEMHVFSNTDFSKLALFANGPVGSFHVYSALTLQARLLFATETFLCANSGCY